MISQLTNLHKRSDLDEKIEFRTRVLALLRELFPSLSFSESDDVEIIKSGEMALGLTNLHAKFLQSSQMKCDLRTLTEEHFAGLLDVAMIFNGKTLENWDEIRSRLLPQLMPAEYRERMSVVSLPLGDEVVIGIVLDGERSYSYVTEENLEKWNVSLEVVYETALENLKSRSSGLESTFVPPPNGIVAIDSCDGFDAARIVLPEIRAFCWENLGGPFYFSVPNRDFLICWSASGDDAFQNGIVTQVAADFRSKPYPLSDRTFEVDEHGRISQREPTGVSPPRWAATN